VTLKGHFTAKRGTKLLDQKLKWMVVEKVKMKIEKHSNHFPKI